MKTSVAYWVQLKECGREHPTIEVLSERWSVPSLIMEVRDVILLTSQKILLTVYTGGSTNPGFGIYIPEFNVNIYHRLTDKSHKLINYPYFLQKSLQ